MLSVIVSDTTFTNSDTFLAVWALNCAINVNGQ